MISTTTLICSVAAIFGAIGGQIFFRPLLFNTLGFFRDVQPITDFPYQCRRIHDPRLSACEDMWLSEASRQLFLACSDSVSRTRWAPNVGHLNASGRGLDDAVIAMDIDKPARESFEYRVLRTPGFSGVQGDGRLALVGLTGRDTIGGEKLGIDLFLVNARPTIDSSTGELAHNEHTGADMTIEQFQTGEHAAELRHKQTFRHAEIRTPNNVALSGAGDGFFITNDHGTAKTGLQFQLANILQNGDVAYCSSPTTCHTLTKNLAFPNGLIMGQDGRLYVPSTFHGGIHVYRVTPSNNLEKEDFIDIPYPLDNLSQDRNGDIWAAAITKLPALLAAFKDPLSLKSSPSTVFRIRKKTSPDEGWEVEKVLEDRDGEVLPGATTAIHDVKTGRVFLSGILSPFITVCEPSK